MNVERGGEDLEPRARRVYSSCCEATKKASVTGSARSDNAPRRATSVEQPPTYGRGRCNSGRQSQPRWRRRSRASGNPAPGGRIVVAFRVSSWSPPVLPARSSCLANPESTG